MARDPLGSYPSMPESPDERDSATPAETLDAAEKAASAEAAQAPDAAETPKTPEEPRRPRTGLILLVALCVLAVATAGVWFYARATAPVEIPSVVSLTPQAAEGVLRAAHLASGKATYAVTKGFPAGRIISQSPGPFTRVAQGSPVDVRIAVAPKLVSVPDVVGAESDLARRTLEYALFTPTIIYAYSTSVHTGEVIEQLPRAGDSAMTGSADVVVVSLGVGKSGSHVPAIIGATFPQASRVASDARLFVQPRAVIATGTPDGTIVDQAPSANTVVPVGTNIFVSIADSRARP